jgi:hypothetical protein
MMTTKARNETPPTWAEIEKRVIESFNLDDVGANYGVSRWREHAEKARGVEDAGEVAYPFTSSKVLDAVVEFFKADIAENIAIYQVKLARNARLLKLMNLRVALGEAQGVFVDEEDGEHIVPELLAVLRVTKSAKTKMLQQVVQASMTQASMTLAHNNGDENAEQPSWPAGLGDGIQDFANDLSEFIATNGEEGREIVTRVCEDINFAKEVCNNEDLPRPIRFLGQVVVEANTNNHLPKKERRIGFGFGSR